MPDLGQTFLPDPPHGWNDTHAAWNGGRYDQWVPNKGVTTMTYHTRGDLPYQFALADAFTICDNYHCSLLGPTDPNRYHMWTGWVGNDGSGGGPVITNAEAGLRLVDLSRSGWSAAGISWKVYQDIGVGLDAAGFWGWTDDPYIGNYGDNSLLYFHQYQNALPGTPLADKAKTGTEINAQNRDPEALLTDFRADVRERPAAAGLLDRRARGLHRAPQLGAGLRRLVRLAGHRHPRRRTPRCGARWPCSSRTTRRAASSTTWSRRRPPQTPAQGLSTVPITNEIFPGDGDAPGRPVRPRASGCR